MSRTADELLEGVKARASIVTSQSLLSPAKILAFADKIIEAQVVPILMRVNGEFLVNIYDQDLVADQAAYRIHYRSAARTIREAQILDENDEVVCDLPVVPLEEAYLHSAQGEWASHFRGDKLVILPTPATGVTEQLRQYYYLKPSRLIQSTDARQVTAITATTVTLSDTTLPDTFVAAAEMDFIQEDSGCSLLAMDKAIASINGQELTFAAGDIPTDLAVGDWVAPAGKSPMLMLPDEAFDMVEALTTQRVLKAKSDFEGAKELVEDIKAARDGLVDAIQPRQKGEPQVIMNPNGLMHGRRGISRIGMFYRVT